MKKVDYEKAWRDLWAAIEGALKAKRYDEKTLKIVMASMGIIEMKHTD